MSEKKSIPDGKPPYLGSVPPNQFYPPRFENNEQPLTHHQQAVKDFMCVIIKGLMDNTESIGQLTLDAAKAKSVTLPEYISNSASQYADAFINQIKK